MLDLGPIMVRPRLGRRFIKGYHVKGQRVYSFDKRLFLLDTDNASKFTSSRPYHDRFNLAPCEGIGLQDISYDLSRFFQTQNLAEAPPENLSDPRLKTLPRICLTLG